MKMRREPGAGRAEETKKGRKEKENEEGEQMVIFVSGSCCVKISSTGSHVEFPLNYVGEYWFSQNALAMSTVTSGA